MTCASRANRVERRLMRQAPSPMIGSNSDITVCYRNPDITV
jgi:hypothetical protein